MTITQFSFPTTIHFGPGARKLVGLHLSQLGLRRPLVVTDRGLATLPVLYEFMDQLKTCLDAAVYSGVHGNPTASQVTLGVGEYKSHRADCVIGFGGGAALDIAKVVAAMAVHDGNVIEYAWDHPKVRPRR
jgi:alcohol dehydrogenase class IV